MKGTIVSSLWSRRRLHLFSGLVIFSILFLMGCRAASPDNAPPSISVFASKPSPSQTPSPVIPTSTPEPTGTSTPTPTASPSPTLHPMNILAMRQTPYPGSVISIEEALDPGPNYYRYYVSYRSEGLKIYALLTVPYADPPAGGYPAIVFNHGYIPPEIYRTTERYVAYVDRLAGSGYVVFRIDYRGHDRSEGFATGAYGSPGYTVDVMNAVAAVQTYLGVNPEKIGMWGHSMGGYLTLRAMVISDDVKAGVIWGGVVASYDEMLNNWRRRPRPTSTPGGVEPRRWRTSFVQDYGTPEENPEFWSSISANSYLVDLSGPVQLHHAVTDESVPVEFSILLNDQILQDGKTSELYTYEADDHNISQFFSLAMARTIEFFDLYLKN